MGVRDSDCCSISSNGNSVLIGISSWGSTAPRLYSVVLSVYFIVSFMKEHMHAYTGQNTMYSSVISVISSLKVEHDYSTS